jgi:hypothetical protein
MQLHVFEVALKIRLSLEALQVKQAVELKNIEQVRQVG